MRGAGTGGAVGIERPDDEFRVEADDGEQREQRTDQKSIRCHVTHARGALYVVEVPLRGAIRGVLSFDGDLRGWGGRRRNCARQRRRAGRPIRSATD